MPLPAALPPLVPEPFAQNANPANINTIPATTGSPGVASYDIGFPPVTMEPVIAGGIPPLGQDFNGIFFAITAHLYYLQSGQRWPFNATVATAIGGYPVGAIVAMADGTGEWINTVANNSTDPDSVPTSSSYTAGWRPVYSYGAATVAVSAGVNTPTTVQAKKTVLIFTGVLTGNASVNLPPSAQEWLLVNITTGAFPLTVNAGSGVGQSVPQSGFGAPLGVYSIGDGNLYPSVSPLGVPISVPAVANTLVERDNNGNIYVVYINSSAGADNIGIANVITDTGDGWFRKNSLANFEGQLFLQNINGAVTAGQVPVGAVTQYSPQILASAILTGTPTAPTQAPGTANTTVATTAFVNPGSSLNSNGYRHNPDGSIDQWGSFAFTANGGTTTQAFPIPFPAQCFNVVTDVIAPGGLGGAGSYQADQPSAPGTSTFQYRSVSSANPGITIVWRAIGK